MGTGANADRDGPVLGNVWIGHQDVKGGPAAPTINAVKVIVGAKRFDWRNWPHDEQTNVEKGVTTAPIPIISLDATMGVGTVDIFNTHLLRFISLGHPIVVVDRMDEIDFEQEQFELIEEEFTEQLTKHGLHALTTIPGPIDRFPDVVWLDELSLSPKAAFPQNVPITTALRIAINSVTKSDLGWRLEGRLLSGEVSVGDEVLSSPSNRSAVVDEISRDGVTQSSAAILSAHEGTSIVETTDITLILGSAFFAETNEILSHSTKAPIVSDVFCARLRWTGGNLKIGDAVICKTALGEFGATLQSIDLCLDPVNRQTAGKLELCDDRLAEVTLRASHLVALDTFETRHKGGAIELTQIGGEGVGVGLISMQGYADQRRLLAPKSTNITSVQHAVTDEERRERNGHDGGVLWFTGLSGSGKSTLAVALEARLFHEGYQVFVLDGDNVRQGLTSNLGFSPDDRAENIRRVGEVTALFRQAGTIVISSFISPYRSDRDRARHAASSGFHEIYIQAPVETCIARDPKGLYKRALQGDIRNFTGVSAPYEEPENPEMVVDTEKDTITECVDQLVNYVDRNFRL